MKTLFYIAAVAFAAFAVYTVGRTLVTEQALSAEAEKSRLTERYVVDVLWAKINCTDVAFGNFDAISVCDTSLVSTDNLSFRSKEIVKLRNIEKYTAQAKPGKGYKAVKLTYRVKPKKHEEEVPEVPEPGPEL